MLKKNIFIIAIFAACSLEIGLSFQVQEGIVNSVLAEGDWYKIAVDEDGVYKVNQSQLQSWGLDPESIDPKKIKIYGNGGKMLPQSNSTPRPTDLVENAITVVGENDGSFDDNDYILFYGQGPDSYYYDEENDNFLFEDNVYEDFTYYFLTVSGENGLRIENQDNLGNEFSKIQGFDHLQAFEENFFNVLNSGREWYGTKVREPFTKTFEANGINANSDIELTIAVMAKSFVPSFFTTRVNSIEVGTQDIPSVPDSRYAVKGKDKVNIFEVPASSVTIDDDKINITVEYSNTSSDATGYINYLLLRTNCRLQISNNTTIFRSVASLENPFSTFEIENTAETDIIWDISSPLAPVNQEFTMNNTTAQFGTPTMTLKEFVVFRPTATLRSPEFIEKVVNQNIHNTAIPDLLIVTHEDFKSEALRLANFRQDNDQLSVKVVTTSQIFNEFGSGSKDVTAIRDYVKYLFDNGQGDEQIQHLLLFGRSSYDYQDLTENNTNFVPIYQSRNSLHPLQTYSSDDYFTFLEDGEGEWLLDHTLDIGVGRLPIKDIDEATNMVNKIINYSQNQASFGSWRNKVAYIADDGDFNIHQSQADNMATFIDTAYSTYNPQKIYLDAFPQTLQPSGLQLAPDANDAINQVVREGALIINFTGHGGEFKLTDESILVNEMIESWDNADNLPLFVTATCEFGRHDNPNVISGGELTVLNKKGGAIAIVTTARPVSSSTNFELNKAFYNAVFERQDGKVKRLGDVFKGTKNNSLSGANNRNFSLLGDPTLTLAYPQHHLKVTAIKNDISGEVTDTIKALSRIKIEGLVTNNDGSVIQNFNGILDATIFGKANNSATLGDENNVFNYKSRDNLIFKGKATIENGHFNLYFVVPKSISYLVDKGKISLYGTDLQHMEDAGGGNIDLFVGGTADNPTPDTSPPSIQMYMNDTSFINGGTTGNSPTLIANLHDENGINISNFGISNSIVATLDGETEYILNDFYTSILDDYKSGWVSFPFSNLPDGEHKLTLKAWDTYNNSNEATITFWVSDEKNITITNLKNYPNPIEDYSTFSFEHNRAGQDLDVSLTIYSPQGQEVENYQTNIINAPTRVEILHWNNQNSLGEKLFKGIYVYRLFVRSNEDGSKNQQYKKLVIVK